MSNTPLQSQLFENIKAKLLPNRSMVEEVAQVLGITTDSAYRRIRGDKTLGVDELHALCVHFKISLDHLLNLSSDSFVFTGSFADPQSFRYDHYVAGIVQQLKYMSSFKEKVLIYLAKDIPMFHLYHFREITSFKYYFWMKNIMQSPEFANKKFRIEDFPDEYWDLTQSALKYYNELDSIELWNFESINSTIRQIDFYRDSNIFSNSNEVDRIYDALEKLISHLELQATEGKKFFVDEPQRTAHGLYSMYTNEILILEGNILAILDGSKTAFLIHNVLNILRTNDVHFCDNMHLHIQNLIKKSTLISTVSEKERGKFFKSLRNRIDRRRKNP